MRTWLTPLRLVGAPVEELSLTLLLSLRFLAVVFEEVRNLALGLAARNIQWRALGSGAGLQVSALHPPCTTTSILIQKRFTTAFPHCLGWTLSAAFGT